MSSLHGQNPCLGELTEEPMVFRKGTGQQRPACDFAEGRVWEALGGGWQCLHGCYCQHGVSIEWHDFSCEKSRDWGRSFHPGSIELCLNVSGHGRLTCERESVLLGPLTVGLYAAADDQLSAWRLPGERHQFLTVEYSPGFLEQHLNGHEAALHPVVRQALRQRGEAAKVAPPQRLTLHLRKRIERLRLPPVVGAATKLWYQARALELMAEFFFVGAAEGRSSPRQQAVSRQRTQRVIEILAQRLADPPGLEELGRQVGCSPYHLSRTFSREMGMSLPQYVRQIRMERAAELLKSGQRNVTEAALEVGYNSLSHFSHAFCETMGCCPGLYPLGLTRSAGTRPVLKPGTGGARHRQ